MRAVLLALLMGVASPVAALGGQEAADVPSENAAYYFLLGRHLEGKGQVEEAIAAHRRAIELEPEAAELRAELAGLYARQDKALEALETAESALRLDPDNREANRILGSVYAAYAGQQKPLRPGDDPKTYAGRAIAALEKARRENQLDLGLELSLGRLYVETGDFSKALQPLQDVVDEQPGYAEAYFLLSAAQEGAGRVADAIRTLESVVARNPDYFRGHLRLAELYERQQQWARAAQSYAAAQRLNPRASALTGRRAAALLNAGEAAEARKLVENALAGTPTEGQQAILLYLLAESQRALDDLAAAEATANRLLEANPDDPRGLHVMALILQEKGDVSGAERALRTLIARDPLDAGALNSLGYMFAERGERLGEAVELLQRALKIDPGNPAYLDSLGWAYFQQGRIDLADEPLTKAAERLRDSSVVQDHLGDLRFRQQRYEEAAEAWERALAGDGESIERETIEKKLRDARARMESR